MKVTITKDSIFFENEKILGNIFILEGVNYDGWFTSHSYHDKNIPWRGRQTYVTFNTEKEARKFFNRLASALKNS